MADNRVFPIVLTAVSLISAVLAVVHVEEKDI